MLVKYLLIYILKAHMFAKEVTKKMTKRIRTIAKKRRRGIKNKRQIH